MISLVVAGLVALTAAAVPKVAQMIAMQTRKTRLAGLLSTWEFNVKAALMNPRSFKASGGNIQLETLANIPALKSVAFPGARCPAGTPVCGLIVVTPSTSPNPKAAPTLTKTGGNYFFTATLRYNGSEVKMNNIVIQNFQIPAETVQAVLGASSVVSCTTSNPIFKGINASGAAICGAAPTPCTTSQSASSLSASTFAPTCQPLPTITCKSTEYLKSFSITNGGTSVTHSCAARIDPNLYRRPE